jgi:hypothetical protein
MTLRTAAAELAATSEVAMHGLLHVRLGPADVRRFNRRLDKLIEDVHSARTVEGEPWGLAAAFYRVGPS